jgi:AcrR family transcriptional regulator
VPRRVDHEQRRGQIVAALLRIAAARGLQAVTMREVAAEAGVSLRLVQYYGTDKATLLGLGLAELAARLDRRVRERAAGLGTGLSPREVLGVVLGSVLPTDEQSLADRRAWTAYFAVVVTDPGSVRAATSPPDALEGFLAAQLDRAGVGLAPGVEPRREATALLALTNGLADAVLGGQHDAATATAVLEAHLDRLFA